MEVYLDNSATTRTFPEVAELMSKIMCEDYGNPRACITRVCRQRDMSGMEERRLPKF